MDGNDSSILREIGPVRWPVLPVGNLDACLVGVFVQFRPDVKPGIGGRTTDQI